MKKITVAIAVGSALAFMTGASTAQANDTAQPCPTIVQVKQAATLVCDDGTVTFDLSAMTPGVTYQPFVKAGSHTVSTVIVVGDEFRVWYDQPMRNADGSTLSRITILNMRDGNVRQMGY